MPTLNKDVVVIGASAGGLSALEAVIAGLPRDYSGTLYIVVHMGPTDRSNLASILARVTTLPVSQVHLQQELVRSSHIYVARPDFHMVLESGAVCSTRGPRENRFRPSVDVLFRSAAYVYSARAVGVILSGSLDDGSAGLWWVGQRGGTTIVQEPADAEFAAMPENALLHTAANHVLPAAEIGPLLARLGQQPTKEVPGAAARQLEVEVHIAKEGSALQSGIMELGELSPYTCPECQGILLQLQSGGMPHFRCHTGHAYSINTLLSEVTEYVEGSLWSSIRRIEESYSLLNHLAKHIRGLRGDDPLAKLLEEKARDTLNRAELLRAAVNDQVVASSQGSRKQT